MLPRIASILAAGMVMMIHGSAAHADPVQVTEVEGISEYQLDNGLRVLLFPDASKPQITVNMTVFVGSRHEGYGEAGMAHLLEHMLFKGTPAHPDIPKSLKDLGAKFNGTTWLDRTNYFETLTASRENLEAAISLEADRLVNSYVSNKDLQSEMSVVRNEFERGENSPERVLEQRMMAIAYEWHNYGQSTIGNRADIERVPIDRLKAFYRKYYQPDNTMVIVAGNFDPNVALGLIQEHFGIIPRPERKLEETYTEEPAQDGERQVTLRRVGDIGLAGAIYHIPAGAHPDYVAVDVLEHILTSAPSGRLYQALVETKLAASVSGAAYALHDPGILQIIAEASPGIDPRDVLSKMLEVCETIGADGVTQEEVERAKRYWLKNWELTMSDTAAAARQLTEWAAQGDWRLIFLYRDRLEKVTVSDVDAVATKYLRQNNRTAGLFIPTKEAERSTVPPTPDLAEMIGDYKGREAVAAGEAFKLTPENIEKRTTRQTLPSGLQAAFLPKKTRGGSVIVRINLRYGTAESLQGMAQATEVLPSLMARGTNDLTRQEIQDEFDRLKSRLTTNGSAGAAAFELETRRENLIPALSLLTKILREPAFPEDEFEIVRNARVANATQALTDPGSLAQVALSRAVSKEYPKNDIRYIPTVEERVENWNHLELQQVKRLYEAFLNGTYGEVAIVGDFDPHELQPVLTEMFADWKSENAYAHIPQSGDVDIDTKRQSIETPDKENAFYFAGSVFSMSDKNPDYPALLIGNYVLGSGGLSSRLGNRIRQKEGLSYSIASMVNPSSEDQRTVFFAYAISNPSNMPKVEKGVMEEIELLRSKGVTEDELKSAVTGYLERQIVDRSDDKQLAATLAATSQLDRTMKFYENRESAIRSLSVDDVNAAVNKWIRPDRMAVVVAGDFAKAKKQQAEASESKEEE